MSLRHRLRTGGDRGSIAPLIPFVILALLFLGGLVVDGSRALNARNQAQSYAEEAARAGASAVDLTADPLALQPGEAKQRVDQYCANVMANSHGLVTKCEFLGISDVQTCNGSGGTVTEHIVVSAHVTMSIPTSLLGIFGFSTLPANGQAKARPYEGTSAANAC